MKTIIPLLASVHTTGKLSWAAATGSIRECKMRIERIGGSRLDTDSEVWGLDQTTWELTSGNYTCNIMSFNFKRHNNTYKILKRHNYVFKIV